ncbi:acyl-CoA dehydrogenase family protein, partial [Streptomyces sp. NPDC005568]|uniref:acyl-CoA dehydrogenase family protein n=1 Tax=Streptomyces sp. NPDC005568 TaxID=3156887 RepID=UPI0033B5F982
MRHAVARVGRLAMAAGGGRGADRCPIARLYADNRVNRIYGGTSEIMKTIIAKDMG